MSGLPLCSWFDCEGRYVCFCRYLIRPRINGETEIKEGKNGEVEGEIAGDEKSELKGCLR